MCGVLRNRKEQALRGRAATGTNQGAVPGARETVSDCAAKADAGLGEVDIPYSQLTYRLPSEPCRLLPEQPYVLPEQLLLLLEILLLLEQLLLLLEQFVFFGPAGTPTVRNAALSAIMPEKPSPGNDFFSLN